MELSCPSIAPDRNAITRRADSIAAGGGGAAAAGEGEGRGAREGVVVL